MKALAVFQLGEDPRYTADFPEPVKKNEQETHMRVKASAIKNLDRMRASGKHYSVQTDDNQPKVVGMDGVGILEDGTRAYAMGITGMVAENALVNPETVVPIPDQLDDAMAAALPNAVMGSAMAMKFRVALKQGETVLINGATGVTGQIAVQLAKCYGAGKVIVTGRNEETLEALRALGADELIPLKQTNEGFVEQLQAIHRETPLDVVIDYLWGHSAELILDALKGNGRYTHRTRFVTIGGMTGDRISLSSGILRSTDIVLSGSGIGSWTPEETKQLITEILPETFVWAAAGKLTMELETVTLAESEGAWNRELQGGTRLVILVS